MWYWFQSYLIIYQESFWSFQFVFAINFSANNFRTAKFLATVNHVFVVDVFKKIESFDESRI